MFPVSSPLARSCLSRRYQELRRTLVKVCCLTRRHLSVQNTRCNLSGFSDLSDLCLAITIFPDNTDWQHTVSLSTGPTKVRDWAEEYVLCCQRVLCRWSAGHSLMKILTTKASRSSVKWMSCSRETSSRTTIWPPYLTLHVTDYGTWTIHAYHIYVYIEICLYKKDMNQ